MSQACDLNSDGHMDLIVGENTGRYAGGAPLVFWGTNRSGVYVDADEFAAAGTHTHTTHIQHTRARTRT